MAISTSRWRRSARLLGLPGAAVVDQGRGLGRRLSGSDRDDVRRWARERNVERTRRVLGDLKGGPLKAGQLLSTVDALMPQDPDGTWSSALRGLQEDNEALPFAQVRGTLDAELGAAWRQQFRDFDESAVAAASIGQVHRATWSDGRRVAVKIQYPGIGEALAGDIAMLSASLRLTTLVARGLALPPLVGELRARLAEELDYEREGHHQAAFANAFADDPEFEVPAVVVATPKVLVSEWLDGEPLASVALTGTSRQRDHLGALYQRFFLCSPERVGLLHTDPHPGNFRLTSQGKLGALDFGSVLSLPGGMPPTFGSLIRVLMGGDDRAVLAGLRAGGFLRNGRNVDTRALRDYLAPFTEPADHETFHYSRTWLARQFGRINDPRNPDFAVALQLNMPAEHLFTHRVWLGLVGVLCQLDACVPVSSELQRWLPGYVTPPGPLAAGGHDTARGSAEKGSPPDAARG